MADGLVPQPVVNEIAALQGNEPPAVAPQPASRSPGIGGPSYQHAFLSTALAGRGDKRLALAVLLLSALGFAMALPFARILLYRVDAFIPAYETALILIGAITAVMLFGQFHWSRSTGLLVLGAGYLFEAVLVVAHLLSFPGALAQSGLLGGGQTTVWLYMFWHSGFPLFVIAYALLSRWEIRRTDHNDSIGAAAVGLTVIGSICLGIGLTLLAARHETWLPTLLSADNTYRPAYLVMCRLPGHPVSRRSRWSGCSGVARCSIYG